ncbi:putative LPS assembly protein LptD [Kordia zhangzhouensis]|uniref:putative LPS assembly protein LptD n=1 Tax=Kordia zhangzhouensis TaxID=1620405 RepID=UPI00373FC649
MLVSSFAFSQELPERKKLPFKPENGQKLDTLKVQLRDSIKIGTRKVTDSIKNDSIRKDSIPEKPPVLLDQVKYKSKDYVKISQRTKKIYLYNEAELYYQDTELKSGIIILDYEKNEVYAGRLKDSAGVYSQAPYFKQGTNIVEPDSIRFNFDTEKALIWNSRTEQNGTKIAGELTKKENDSVIFIKNAKFTTSKDIENPEYYFLARKIKLVPNKKIVSGVTNMYIADVPTPIGFPFAYFPLTDDRASGFIFPTFGENSSRGYFFQNGGYYFAISDYFDLALLGDYYTNGSYALRGESNYALRYRFRGNLSVRFEAVINSQRGFPDYSKSNIYNIRWSHNQDPKANPNSRFSASVNLGSSQYYQASINQLNTPNFLNNTLNSSVSYSKTFPSYPSVNVSLTATHSQNTNTESINLTLPTLQASVERIYPFAKRDGTKKGIIENINFQYNLRGENRINTTDSLFFTKEMFDDAKMGIRQSIPINTNFKLFNYLSVSLGGNYDEVWTFKTTNRTDAVLDPTPDDPTRQIASVKDTINGFDSFRQYNFSASIGTTLYGTFTRGEDKKIQAIRHTLRPSISYSYNPAFDQYYDEYIIDAENNTKREYTRFEDGLFGVPSRTYASSIGINVANTVEAKVRSKDSTQTEPKKVMLLNSLNFSTSYNIAADSLAWSPVRVTGSTQLFNNKLSVNFGANLDPYAIDNQGLRINKFNIDNGGSLFRLTSANINMNYSFSSKSFDGKGGGNTDNTRSGGRDDDLFGQAQDFSDNRTFDDDDDDEEKEDVKAYRAKIPWDLRVAYSLTYANNNRQSEISNNSLMFSGNVELTPQWKVGVSSGYDFKNKGFTFTQMRFERDLKSWRINFNWVPFSSRASWYFFIGIKASILRDVKWEQRSEPDRRL